MKSYNITKKFKFWCAPIVDRSFGSLTFDDVLEFLQQNNLADFFNNNKPRKPKNEEKLPEYEAALKKYNEWKKTKLASVVIPIVEKGVQPIGPTGPSDNFKTKNHEWEHTTPEYKRMRNILMGMPPDKAEPVLKPEVTIIKKEELLQ